MLPKKENNDQKRARQAAGIAWSLALVLGEERGEQATKKILVAQTDDAPEIFKNWFKFQQAKRQFEKADAKNDWKAMAQATENIDLREFLYRTEIAERIKKKQARGKKGRPPGKTGQEARAKEAREFKERVRTEIWPALQQGKFDFKVDGLGRYDAKLAELAIEHFYKVFWYGPLNAGWEHS